MPDIQILIAAYGRDSLKRIANLRHPQVSGVEYVVGWQRHDMQAIPRELLERKDFRIVFENSTGLCNNRNSLLDIAEADIAVISDDDLEYTPQQLDNIRNSFIEHPDCHFLTFRYVSQDYPKFYPDHSFDLKNPPKGYFVTSMEMAFNMKKIRKEGLGRALRFNPAFGVNGDFFGSCEEDIVVADILRSGFKGIFIPKDICINTDSTTSERIGHTREFIETKGASMLHVKPISWPLRMLSHARRASAAGGRNHISFMQYCRWWLAGCRKARKHKVFAYVEG